MTFELCFFRLGPLGEKWLRMSGGPFSPRILRQWHWFFELVLFDGWQKVLRLVRSTASRGTLALGRLWVGHLLREIPSLAGGWEDPEAAGELV